MIVWFDTALMPEENATLSIHDRGFLFADAIFETALLHDGGFFRLREHLDRFAESAATMRIEAPGPDELDSIVRDVVRANELRNANIRITLTRGVRTPVLIVAARPRDDARVAAARAGWRIMTARTRRPSTASMPGQLKSVGRTYALLARHEAAEAGVDDALLLTDYGHVCEGPTWNVFWRRGSILCTPSLETGVLAGITRTAMLQLAPGLGLRVQEELFDRSELDHADEIFATMTSVGIAPFRELDGRALRVETTTADALQQAYADIVAREAARDPAARDAARDPAS